jgi:hypothetical protein
MKKRRGRNLVILKKGPKKEERKNHLKENTKSILKRVTVTLILIQTPVVRNQHHPASLALKLGLLLETYFIGRFLKQ